MSKLAGAIDGHVHVADEGGLQVLLRALQSQGLRQAIVVGSGRRVFDAGASGAAGLVANNALLLRAGAASRGALGVLVGIDEVDPGQSAALPGWIRAGAVGIKLYAGHADYHRGALDRVLAPLLARAERRSWPVLLHVNGVRYADELHRLLARHPRARVLCPHLCLLSGDLPRLQRLLAAHSNLWLDISFGAFTRRGFALADEHHAALRSLILRHRRRLVFASDAVVDAATAPSELVQAWRAYLGLLFARAFRHQGRRYRGLALPASLRPGVLYENARAWLTGVAAPQER